MRGLLYAAALILVVSALVSALQTWRRSARPGRPAQRDELVKDPVCQTYVLLSRAVATEVDGVVRRFCSRECAARFARGERGR